MSSTHKIIGSDFNTLKLKRADKVLPLSTITSSVKIRDEIIPVDTMHLFSRIMCFNSPGDLSSCFQFELAPQPLSMFDGMGLMRKGNKSDMYKILEALAPCEDNW